LLGGFYHEAKTVLRDGVILKALSSPTGVALRWNSVLVFVASAASFGFYMSAVSSRFSHPSQPSTLISYDAGESRERSSDRSRPHRERPAIVERRTALGTQRSLTPVRVERALVPQSVLPRDTAANETFLNLLIRIISVPFPEALNGSELSP
jgi:hypothetical protein